MTHEPKTAALLAYEEDLLSVEGRARLQRHLGGCDVCKRELASMRLFEKLANDVKETPVPEVHWEKMELALRREAREQAKALKKDKAANYAPLLGICAAAAAVAIAVSQFGGFGDQAAVNTTPPEDHAHVAVVQPERDGELVQGVVMAVAGYAGHDNGHIATSVLPQLAVGDTIRESDRIVTDASGQADVRMLDGTGFVVASSSAVRLLHSRERAIELSLAQGEVSSQVHHLVGEERYLVHAGDYSVRVRGTRFSVKRAGEELAVSVDEGFVEVSKNGEVLSVVRAPGQWGSSPALAARTNGQVPRARGLDAAALSWPTLTLPATPGIVSWTVDGTTAPASGLFAMRVAPGLIDVVGFDARGAEIHANYTMMNEGATLDTAHLFVRHERPEAREGSLDAAAVQQVVRQGVPQLQRCLERSLRVRPDLNVGAVRVRLTVDAHGEVAAATFVQPAGATVYAPLTECITTQARTWAFPAPTGGAPVHLEVPLNLATMR